MKKEKKPINPQDEMVRLQQELLAKEVDEEMHREKMRALWMKYRFVVLGFVIGVLLITVGLEVFQSWRTRVSMKDSDAFENAVILAYTGNPDKAITALQEIAKKSHTGYEYLAQMKIAGILFQQGKDTEALDMLKKVIDSGAPKELKSVATLSYVGHQIDTANAQELQKMLTPLLKSNNPYRASAAELSAALYLKENNKQEAIAVLKGAISDELASPFVKERLNGLLTVIEK